MPPGSPLIARAVAASARHPLAVLLLALLLSAAALAFTARNFAMTADTAELISTDLPWRQREIARARNFPQNRDLIVAVLDGTTPEIASGGGARLVAALRARPDLFRSARDPLGDPFFARNGLLLLPSAEVERATEGLINAQPFLGPLAADPSLRGVMTALSTVLEGVRRGGVTLADMAPALTPMAEALERALDGRPAFFSWRTLLGGTPAGVRENRRFVLVQPVLDYANLQPGAAATRELRRIAAAAGLTPDAGVTLRLTGPVPLADEEFGTLAENWVEVTAAMVVALVGILWLAVRSWRVSAAVLLTTFLGLVITAGIGLAVVGRFNLISVAFIPLFVGLGMDFSIQFAVRFLAERGAGTDARATARPDKVAALAAAGRGVGGALALAAAAIAAGLLAFLPTSYVGVAELGAIAGIGMGVAFLLSVTLLPALLALLPPRSGMAEAGFPALAPVASFLTRRRGAVLAAGAAAALASAALLPWVRFDFNPLHLRSPAVESMATLRDLSADPDRTPNTLDVLVATPEEAAATARRLAALPEVARVVTLDSFVPADQDAKLILVRDAADLLGPTLLTPDRLPPPEDTETVRALTGTAASLRAAAEARAPEAAAASRLAAALERLAAAPPEARARAADVLVTPLNTLLDGVRDLLRAGPVTRESLPPDLVADWTARDGRHRVSVYPVGNTDDNAVLERFSVAVQRVAPDATGVPISIREAGGMIVTAFAQAGALSFLAVVALLAATLRRVRDVALAMAPVLLSGLLTFASCAALGLPLNFANIIALPLLFGVGVAFNIYFVVAWRAGETGLLQSSLTRAVVFSALTTATAFGALWLSSHPGTASMGRLLMLSLGWEILVTLLFRPALLAVPPAAPLAPAESRG